VKNIFRVPVENKRTEGGHLERTIRNGIFLVLFLSIINSIFLIAYYTVGASFLGPTTWGVIIGSSLIVYSLVISLTIYRALNKVGSKTRYLKYAAVLFPGTFTFLTGIYFILVHNANLFTILAVGILMLLSYVLAVIFLLKYVIERARFGSGRE
jgi:Ca2+/Na+ antiporter